MNQPESQDPYEPSLSTATPVPWTPRDVAWGLGVFVLWILFFGIVGLVGERVTLPVDAGLMVVFGEAVLLLPVWYFTIHKYGVDWADLGLRGFQPWAVGLGCGLMLLSLLFNLVFAAFLSLWPHSHLKTI